MHHLSFELQPLEADKLASLVQQTADARIQVLFVLAISNFNISNVNTSKVNVSNVNTSNVKYDLRQWRHSLTASESKCSRMKTSRLFCHWSASKVWNIIWRYSTDEGQNQIRCPQEAQEDEGETQGDQQEGLGQAVDAGNPSLSQDLTCFLCHAPLHVLRLRNCQGCKKVGFFRSDTIYFKLILCFEITEIYCRHATAAGHARSRTRACMRSAPAAAATAPAAPAPAATGMRRGRDGRRVDALTVWQAWRWLSKTDSFLITQKVCSPMY